MFIENLYKVFLLSIPIKWTMVYELLYIKHKGIISFVMFFVLFYTFYNILYRITLDDYRKKEGFWERVKDPMFFPLLKLAAGIISFFLTLVVNPIVFMVIVFFRFGLYFFIRM